MIENNNSHLEIGELPVLEIVSVNRLIFHEDPDDGRLLRLISRLGTDGVLKNPPIVASWNDSEKYVILDGANRVTALAKLGFRDLAVQVVDLNDSLLDLLCWHHEIDRLGRDFFMQELGKIDDIEIIELEEEQTPPENYLAYFIFAKRKPIAVVSSADIIRKVEILNDLTRHYIHQPISDRVSYINLNHLRKHYPNFETLLTFHRFSKEEFIEIVNARKRLPAGLTRVFLPKRALGLNVPLEILKSQLTVEDKNRWLQQYILHMVQNKTIRFYREATFVFDE